MSADEHARELPDPERRKLLERATAATGGLALAAASYPFVASLAPSDRVRGQGGPVEVDISALAPGALTDPDSQVASQQPEYARNLQRSIRPEVFVTVSLCTHLGCIPSFRPEPKSLGPDWPGGFYCPCHGSKFDFAGRVYKGSPAPTNLVVPRHALEAPARLAIGRDSEGEAL